MHNAQVSALEDLRLYELLERFKHGDDNSFSHILKRFKNLIEKESFNCYLGMVDEDLRAQIYLSLYIRLRQYEIPDAAKLSAPSVSFGQDTKTGDAYEHQSQDV